MATTRRSLRHCGVATMVIGALLALAGCSVEAAARPPRTPVETQTSAPDTSDVSPTPAAADPSDISTWVISGAGIGPIERGAPYPEAVVGLSAFAAEEMCPGMIVFEREGTPRVLVSLSEDGAAVATVWVSGRGADGGAPSVTPVTAAGIGLGSSLDELEAAYPELQQIVQIAEKTWGYAVGDEESGWVDFIVDDESVLTIGSSERPRAPKEFCG
ncbi:hypothetical protein ACWKWP_01870 [Agromyces soli]